MQMLDYTFMLIILWWITYISCTIYIKYVKINYNTIEGSKLVDTYLKIQYKLKK